MSKFIPTFVGGLCNKNYLDSVMLHLEKNTSKTKCNNVLKKLKSLYCKCLQYRDNSESYCNTVYDSVVLVRDLQTVLNSEVSARRELTV